MELLKSIGVFLLIVIVALLIIGLAILIPAWILWRVLISLTGMYVSFWMCVGIIILIELLLGSLKL